MRKVRLFLLGAAVGLPLTILAQAPATAVADVEARFARDAFADGRFRDAVAAYQRAVQAAAGDPVLLRETQAGLAVALLRTGDFAGAREAADAAVRLDPGSARFRAVQGDTLWAAGLFDEGEETYGLALRLDGSEPRAHHGLARALATHGRLDDALEEVRTAIRLDPAEGEFHHTAGVLLERQHRYAEAAAAFRDYVARLPHHDRSETAAWTRAQIRFLDSFGDRTPIDLPAGQDTWTVPLRIADGKALVAIGINGSRPIEFVLDTGAEQTVLSQDVGRRRGVAPVAYMQSAGVGDVGVRGLQIGRIDRLDVGPLRVRNVPCLIKSPPLSGLPGREPESFSPLALGLSMRVDYARRQLTMTRALPEDRYDTELPLRMYRLATVRGVVDGRPASFVVDTGGEVISISQATARLLPSLGSSRRIPVRVYGASGWDRDAFLLPGVDLAFASIRFTRVPVVVLNLHAPSTLLGFNLGGIVGHKFLSRYRVSIDLQRSVLGLDPAS
jgi:predicted aspartyl protease/Flp pilus assembly protein TadD